MAKDTDKTQTVPETADDSGTQETADTPAKKATRPRRTRAKAKAAPTAAEAAEPAATPAAEPEAAAEPDAAGEKPLETVVVVEGRDIRHDGEETILQPIGLVVTEVPVEEGNPPVIVTTVETLTVEGMSPFAPAQDLGDADAIVDMLNGLAEAGAVPEEITGGEPAGAEALGGDLPIPFWYVMVHQVEDAERAASSRRKAGKVRRKLARQVEKAAGLLHDIFEKAAGDPAILAAHERSIARLIALLEVTPPPDKPSQRVFADILRAQRRALAKAIEG